MQATPTPGTVSQMPVSSDFDPGKGVDTDAEAAATQLAFLTLPHFALGALGSAIEALRVANEVVGREAYRWQVVSDDGRTVPSSIGLRVHPTASLDEMETPQMLLVCGSPRSDQPLSEASANRLHELARTGTLVVALDGSSAALAHAGLPNGYAVAAHGLSGPHGLDGLRYAAAEDAAPMAMILGLVARQHGQAAARTVDQLLNGGDQRPDRHRPATSVHDLHEHVLHAVQLMEAHIARPLSMDALAAQVGVSRRQIERLFKGKLGVVPSQYYLGVRLRQARALLMSSTAPIMHIGSACGFETAAHFARCYRRHFGCTPSTDRLRMATGTSHGGG